MKVKNMTIICLLILIFIILIPYSVKSDNFTFELIHTFPGKKEVSLAGDVNGDGYEDIIIGISNSSDTGQAFIYFGSNLIDDIPDVVLSGENSGDWFGQAVSDAGDVNNDGFSDVIVGAPHNDKIAYDAGSAYIYFGGNPMDNIVDVMLNGKNGSSYFGSSLSSAYDLNKDGYDDVIVGAYADGPMERGKAYIYFGGNPMDNISDVVLSGENDDRFGHSVSSAGDINNDSYFDVIVGEPSFSDDEPGWAYIFFGGNPMDDIRDINLTGQTKGDNFGFSVSCAGDINNDGYDDVIVGAPDNDSIDLRSGAAYLFLGDNLMDNISDFSWEGQDFNTNLGCSVSFAGDVNKDSFGDIIIGAYGNEEAYIYLGNGSLENFQEYVIGNHPKFSSFGISVSSAGDIDNDGYSEIIIASKNNAFIYGLNFAPSITINEPDGISDTTDKSYVIKWTDWDPDDNATISLCYLRTLNSTPTQIFGAQNIGEDDEQDQFLWDTSCLMSGNYYIRAYINDGINPTILVHSPGKVTINHSPTITILVPNINNNIADRYFTIAWIDNDNEDNASISLYYDENNLGDDGILIVLGIDENDNLDMYTWNTTNIPDGEYFIYAEIDDGINSIYTNYSIIPLTIHHKIPILSITEVVFKPSSPKDEDKIEVNVTILNSGDGIAKNILVKLLIDDVEIDEIIINEILPNNCTSEIVFEPIVLGEGTYAITVKVEYNNDQITEYGVLVVGEKPIDLLSLSLIIMVIIIASGLLIFYIKHLEKRK